MKRIAKLNPNTPRNIQKILRFLGVQNLEQARRQLGGRYISERKRYTDRTLFSRLKQDYNEAVRIHNNADTIHVRGQISTAQDRGEINQQLKPIYAKYRGQRISIVITQTDFPIILPPELVPDAAINSPEFNRWFHDKMNGLSHRLYELAQQQITNFEAKISVITYTDIQEERLLQIFAHNRTQTCLLDPIEEWITNMKESKNKKTYINKIAKFKHMYPTGVPEGDLQMIADKLAIGINIDVPFVDEFIRIKSQAKDKQRKTFNYLNIAQNHVVYNKTFDKKFALTGTPIEATREELTQMVRSAKEDGECWWFEDIEGIHKVIKEDKIYKYNDPYNDVIQEFEKSIKFDMIDFDLLENKELTTFLYNSIHQMTHYDFNAETDEETHKIDQTKAYASAWKHTNFFEGFLGKITDFRKATKIDQIGFYYVSKFHNLPDWLKAYIKPNVVYASPMLKYLESKGTTFTITHKAVGTKFDFEFTKEMIDKKYYQKWIGQIQKSTSKKRVYFNGSVKYGCHLQFCLKDTDVSIFQRRKDEYKSTNHKQKEYMIEYKRDKDFGCPQLASFLIAYQNITMLEQLEMMDRSKVMRIAVDGIYYEPHEFELHPSFKHEGVAYIPWNVIKGNSLFSRTSKQTQPNITAEERPCYNTEIFVGAGGNGKTHYNLTDTGLNKVLYLAPSHDLRIGKEEEYSINALCFQKIVANKKDTPFMKDLIRKYNVVIIDEASEITNAVKFDLLDKLKPLKIIFCGDINYQLPPIDGDPMNMTGFENVNDTLTKNYRFKDEKQLQIATQLRMMEDDKASAEERMQYALSMYENVSKDYVIKNYKPTDIVLCSLHELRDEWTECLHGEKYRCILSRNGHYTGQISYEKPTSSRDWTYQHGYTIHSVQGKTLDDTIYIDTRNFFQPQMLYTAISRARYSTQIKLITGEEPCKFTKGYIYKITSPNTDKCYIGSTFHPADRWKEHQNGSDTTSKFIINCGNPKFEIICEKNVPFRMHKGQRNSITLKFMESHFIQINKDVVNQVMPT